MYHYGFFWGFPLYPLLWTLIWIVAIKFIFFKGHGRWHRQGYDYTDKSAEDILKTRFAHGEIDEKEYKERMSVLKEHTK